MKLVSIFDGVEQGECRLFSIVLEGDAHIEQRLDEYEEFMDFIFDPERLRDFFKHNPEVLEFIQRSVNEAVERTIELAELIEEALFQSYEFLDELFEPLSNHEREPNQRSKAKSGWIRLYALKIADNYYVITGGAIKTSRFMQDGIMTKPELAKIDAIRKWFVQDGIVDSETLLEVYLYDIH